MDSQLKIKTEVSCDSFIFGEDCNYEVKTEPELISYDTDVGIKSEPISSEEFIKADPENFYNNDESGVGHSSEVFIEEAPADAYFSEVSELDVTSEPSSSKEFIKAEPECSFNSDVVVLSDDSSEVFIEEAPEDAYLPEVSGLGFLERLRQKVKLKLQPSLATNTVPVDDVKKSTYVKYIPKSFYCPHCDYKYASKSQLKMHITAVHPKQKPLSCSHCEFRCVKSYNLKTHILRKHTKKKHVL